MEYFICNKIIGFFSQKCLQMKMTSEWPVPKFGILPFNSFCYGPCHLKQLLLMVAPNNWQDGYTNLPAVEENWFHLVSDSYVLLLQSSHATTGPCVLKHSPYSSCSLDIVVSFPLPHQLASISYSHSFDLLYIQIS